MSTKRDMAIGALAGAIAVLVLVAAIALAVRFDLISPNLPTSVVGAPVCQGADRSGLRFTAQTRDTSIGAITAAALVLLLHHQHGRTT
jgi:hypothetical protein